MQKSSQLSFIATFVVAIVIVTCLCVSVTNGTEWFRITNDIIVRPTSGADTFKTLNSTVYSFRWEDVDATMYDQTRYVQNEDPNDRSQRWPKYELGSQGFESAGYPNIGRILTVCGIFAIFGVIVGLILAIVALAMLIPYSRRYIRKYFGSTSRRYILLTIVALLICCTVASFFAFFGMIDAVKRDVDKVCDSDDCTGLANKVEIRLSDYAGDLGYDGIVFNRQTTGPKGGWWLQIVAFAFSVLLVPAVWAATKYHLPREVGSSETWQNSVLKGSGGGMMLEGGDAYDSDGSDSTDSSENSEYIRRKNQAAGYRGSPMFPPQVYGGYDNNAQYDVGYANNGYGVGNASHRGVSSSRGQPMYGGPFAGAMPPLNASWDNYNNNINNFNGSGRYSARGNGAGVFHPQQQGQFVIPPMPYAMNSVGYNNNNGGGDGIFQEAYRPNATAGVGSSRLYGPF